MQTLHPKVRQAAIDRLELIRQKRIWHIAWLIAQNLTKPTVEVHSDYTLVCHNLVVRIEGHEFSINISNAKWAPFTLVIALDGKIVFSASESDQPDMLRIRGDKQTDIWPEEAKIMISNDYELPFESPSSVKVFAQIIDALKQSNPSRWIRINCFKDNGWEKYLDYSALLEAYVFTSSEDLAKKEETEAQKAMAKPLSQEDKIIAKSLGLNIT